MDSGEKCPSIRFAVPWGKGRGRGKGAGLPIRMSTFPFKIVPARYVRIDTHTS